MNESMTKIGLAVAGILAATWVGSNLSKTTNTTPPSAAATYTGSTYQQSGKTPQQTLAECVRDNVFTCSVHSGRVVADGKLTIINPLHYKDAGNVPVVIPTHLLPPGTTPDTLRGRIIEAKGLPSKYRDKDQWTATSIVVK